MIRWATAAEDVVMRQTFAGHRPSATADSRPERYSGGLSSPRSRSKRAQRRGALDESPIASRPARRPPNGIADRWLSNGVGSPAIQPPADRRGRSRHTVAQAIRYRWAGSRIGFRECLVQISAGNSKDLIGPYRRFHQGRSGQTPLDRRIDKKESGAVVQSSRGRGKPDSLLHSQHDLHFGWRQTHEELGSLSPCFDDRYSTKATTGNLVSTTGFGKAAHQSLIEQYS